MGNRLYKTSPNSVCNNPLEYEELNEYQKATLQDWIAECVIPHKAKTFNPFHTSYGLKHQFEYNSGIYITNGQFKGAMLTAGFEPRSYNDLNWVFKIGKRTGTRISVVK